MPYGVLAKLEDERTPETVAASLRAIADDLESDDELTIEGGDGSDSTVDLPEGPVDYAVELERQPTDEGDEIELDIELAWTLEEAEMELDL